MGVSTDAILAYGFDIGGPEDGIELPWGYKDSEKPDEWEDVYAARMGIVDPDPGGEEVTAATRCFWAKKHELIRSLRVDIVIHCSYEVPAYVVAVKSTVLRAYRGYPKIIEGFEVPPYSEIELKQFCAVMGLEYKEPRWLLFSLWG